MQSIELSEVEPKRFFFSERNRTYDSIGSYLSNVKPLYKLDFKGNLNLKNLDAYLNILENTAQNRNTKGLEVTGDNLGEFMHNLEHNSNYRTTDYFDGDKLCINKLENSKHQGLIESFRSVMSIYLKDVETLSKLVKSDFKNRLFSFVNFMRKKLEYCQDYSMFLEMHMDEIDDYDKAAKKEYNHMLSIIKKCKGVDGYSLDYENDYERELCQIMSDIESFDDRNVYDIIDESDIQHMEEAESYESEGELLDFIVDNIWTSYFVLDYEEDSYFMESYVAFLNSIESSGYRMVPQKDTILYTTAEKSWIKHLYKEYDAILDYINSFEKFNNLIKEYILWFSKQKK